MRYYVTKDGDVADEIAAANGVPVEDLLRANPGLAALGAVLSHSQVLRLPDPLPTPPTVTTPRRKLWD